MPFGIQPVYLIYITVALATVLVIEAVYVIISRRVTYKQTANARLSGLAGTDTGEQALIEFRRRRGLSSDGSRFATPIISFNRLVLQSGVTIGLARIVAICFVLAFGVASLLFVYLKSGIYVAAGAAVVIGVVSPLLVLIYLRSRRRAKIAEQLPDALDIIVRSLRAGHPIPVALGMVGREMGDPVGTEFGLTLDELTYGLDLEQCMRNLYYRVEQEDVGLLATAVSLQTTTGGNLSEVLSNLSHIIRARFKMRRKVKALSAEGRVSAYGLSILPLLTFLFLQIIAPSYYGAIWNQPIVVPLLIGIIIWAMIGMFVMYKMINFKI